MLESDEEIKKIVDNTLAEAINLIELQELLIMCLEILKKFEEVENYENYLVLKRTKVLVSAYVGNMKLSVEEMHQRLTRLSKIVS
jgi:hypothetical protein